MPSKLWNNIWIVSSLHDYSLCCSVKTLVRRGVNCEGPQFSSKCLTCASEHFGGAMGIVTSTTDFALREFTTPGRGRLHQLSVARSPRMRDSRQRHALPYPSDVHPRHFGQPSAEKDLRLRQLPPDGYIRFVGDLNGAKVNVLIDAYARLRNAPPLVLIGRSTDTPQSQQCIFISEVAACRRHARIGSLSLRPRAVNLLEPCGPS